MCALMIPHPKKGVRNQNWLACSFWGNEPHHSHETNKFHSEIAPFFLLPAKEGGSYFHSDLVEFGGVEVDDIIKAER